MPKLAKLIPENEHQFNQIVKQINSALGRNFDREVSEKRSNKFRDTIAEGFGFPDGYQEIKSHWDNKANRDLLEYVSDRELEAFSCMLPGIGRHAVAYFHTDFMFHFSKFVREHFPVVLGKFVGEFDHPTNLNSAELALPMDCGWCDVPVGNEVKAKSTWLPLSLNGVVVGYATDVKLASVLIAILKTISIELPDFINKTIADGVSLSWETYIKEQEFVVTKTPVATLRMDGMAYGLSVPFDTGSYQSDKITLVDATHWEDIEHDVASDVFVWKGMKFDFVSTYHSDPKKTLTIYSVQDDSVNIGDADGVEFFSDGIHVMKADDDTDVLELDRQAALRYNFKFG